MRKGVKKNTKGEREKEREREYNRIEQIAP